jgi:transposase-like protein
MRLFRVARGQRKGHPSPFAKKYRNEMIVEMRRSNVPVRKIAEVHRISVERVRQIIRRGDAVSKLPPGVPG